MESSAQELSHGILLKILHGSCKASDFSGRIRTDIFAYTETLSYADCADCLDPIEHAEVTDNADHAAESIDHSHITHYYANADQFFTCALIFEHIVLWHIFVAVDL